jgi:hypothetical protein
MSDAPAAETILTAGNIEAGGTVGLVLGISDGIGVGPADGTDVGTADGTDVGVCDGTDVGTADGIDVGVRVDATQAASAQRRDLQSMPLKQLLPARQPGQLCPPQSTSVSLPSWTVLAQETGVGCSEGANDGVDVVGLHFWNCRLQYALWQSAWLLHLTKFAHGGQPPPQSMSVSDPSIAWLKQLECLLSPCVHVP